MLSGKQCKLDCLPHVSDIDLTFCHLDLNLSLLTSLIKVLTVKSMLFHWCTKILLHFVYCRQGQFLNVRAEKTSENCFYQAMCSAVQKSGIQMVDYCCTESVMVDKVMPGRMIISYDLFLLLFKIREQICKKRRF